MRPATGFAMLAVGALAIFSYVAVTVGIAGAPGSRIATTTAERSPVADFKSPVKCTLPPGASISSRDRLRVDGACSADITDITCVERSEDLFVSGEAELDDEQTLVVTVLVPGFEGAGDYDHAQVVAQVTGAAIPPRWVSRSALVHVDDAGGVTIRPTALRPQPGTPSIDLIRFEGSVVCEDE